MSLLKTRFIWIVCFFVLSPLSVFAQQPGQGGGAPTGGSAGSPPMRNVFLNVLWGSVTGGVVYEAFNILDDSKTKGERYSFSGMTGKFVLGATYGGLFGLATGTYLSMSGVTFDANRSRIASAPIRAHRLYGDEVLLANVQFHF